LSDCKAEINTPKKICYFRWCTSLPCTPGCYVNIVIDDTDFPKGRTIPLEEFMKLVRSPKWEVYQTQNIYWKGDSTPSSPKSIAECEFSRTPNNRVVDTSNYPNLQYEMQFMVVGVLMQPNWWGDYSAYEDADRWSARYSIGLYRAEPLTDEVLTLDY